MPIHMLWLWVGFNAFVLALLVVDLGLFHRKSHVVSLKEAFLWSGFWITLSLLFNFGIYFFAGPELATQFLAGYLIEKSLSVDNIFIFALLFASFRVPLVYQHRILFWGILGALIMRGLLIALGVTLLDTFHWIFYIFGAFLLVAGLRMVIQREEEEISMERNLVLRITRRIIPITADYEDEHFFVRQAGRLMATPLLLVLLVVESTDLLFALDSLPAVFAVSQNAFIVYTSNVFAILGLRSLYFVVAHVIRKFYYLKIALAVILAFVGVKMLLSDLYHISTPVSLLVIALILVVALTASLVRERVVTGTIRARNSQE